MAQLLWKTVYLGSFSNYMTFRKANYGGSNKDQWLPGDKVEEERTRGAERIFMGVKLLHDTTMINVRHYAFV
jgi:hypothetical protein